MNRPPTEKATICVRSRQNARLGSDLGTRDVELKPKESTEGNSKPPQVGYEDRERACQLTIGVVNRMLRKC